MDICRHVYNLHNTIRVVSYLLRTRFRHTILNHNKTVAQGTIQGFCQQLCQVHNRLMVILIFMPIELGNTTLSYDAK